MAMTRADAANYLAVKLKRDLADAGIDPSDDPGALAEVIDDALLAVGLSRSTTEVSDDQELGFRRVLRYLGMEYVDGERGSQAISLSAGGTSVQFDSRAFGDRLTAAKAAAAPYLVSGEWGSGVIVFDYQEPPAVLR